MKPIFEKYLAYYAALRPETVEELHQLASEDFHFVDPFNDVRSRDKVVHIFNKMFKTVNSPRFEFVTHHEVDGVLYVMWDFTFDSRLLSGGPHHRVRGMSVVREENDKITEHIDYWDSGRHIYRKLPVLGWVIAGLQKVLG